MTSHQLIWLNKGFASAYHLISSIRKMDIDRRFRTLCTHDAHQFPAYELADIADRDFCTSNQIDYVEWALDVCRKYEVDFFWPIRKCQAIASHNKEFLDSGTRLMVCANAGTLDLLNHKGIFLDQLRPLNLNIPPYRRVQSLESFQTAYFELKKCFEKLCIKPSQSIYGIGFFIIGEKKGLDSGHRIHAVKLCEVEKIFSGDNVAEQLVMAYLEGPEYSVDCLATCGKLICCTTRRKGTNISSPQLIEENPEIFRQVNILTRYFELDGLYNVQFRNHLGIPYLLEINHRPSGGIHYSCASGVEYPYWACYLAAGGDAAQVPKPMSGFSVGEVRTAVILERLLISSPVAEI
jgi:hypothetical protein